MTPRSDFSPPTVDPTFSGVEINGHDDDDDAFRCKNAKQVTWVLLLKAHRVIGCVTWLATLVWALFGAIKKRMMVHV